MSFYDTLQKETAPDRERLLSNPLFAEVMAGRVTRELYIAFLTEAYHHVKHTVPLMMACGGRLTDEHEWLRERITHYIDEEYGHHEWILSDIAAAGGDAEAVRKGRPSPETELMVAYAYDTIQRGNPVGFFGMVHVLEGTSIELATAAAGQIAGALGLPKKALTYLNSHGALDLEHVDFFRDLVNRLDREADRTAVIHSARMFFRLYGDIFHRLHQEYSPCNFKQAASF
jgi:pyrroloquinoline quinone (PQQ) biosynthesis protein C